MEEGREKCEMFLNYYFVCFRTFVLDPSSHNYLQALSVYTLVFPAGIISVRVTSKATVICTLQHVTIRSFFANR